MSYNLGVDIEASAYLNYAAGMFRLDIYLHAVTHIKDLIHLTPVCPRAFMNSTEERRHREHIVFDYMNISRDEMQNLCLCASCTMYHSVNVMSHLVKDTLDDRGVCSRGRENELTCVEGRTADRVSQSVFSAIDKSVRYGMVKTFRVFGRKILGEYIMTC